MRLIKLLIISFIVAFMGCAKDQAGEVNIRLSNVSPYDYKNITFINSNSNCEDVNSQQNSEYKVFEEAYRYGFIELEIEGDTFTWQPIDYVGETPLSNGHYSYQIDANDSQEQYGRLSLTLIVD